MFVGDIVDFSDNRINSIEERKNLLSRPNVSNIDLLIIVLSEIPKPDFILVDKLIINCQVENIEPLICINKQDISDKRFIKDVMNEYKLCGTKILITSAKTGKGIKKLKKEIKNKLSSFSGQSAVGKTSILNCLDKNLSLETGTLSYKTDRGKHTTRTSEIFRIAKNTYVTDTPGFSKMNLEKIEPNKLQEFYPEFSKYADKCKFRGCTHVNEPNCQVKKMAEKNIISEFRYYRYLQIYDEIFLEWKYRYGKS